MKCGMNGEFLVFGSWGWVVALRVLTCVGVQLWVRQGRVGGVQGFVYFSRPHGNLWNKVSTSLSSCPFLHVYVSGHANADLQNIR